MQTHLAENTRTPKAKNLRRFGAVCLTLTWAVQIFWLSTEGFGSEHTKSVLLRVLIFLHLNASGAELRVLNTVMRKLAHVAEYGILAALLYFAILNCDRFSWRVRTACFCIAGATVYAFTDEFHQLFVRGRGASLVDCCIDAAGAVLGALAVYLLSRLFGRSGAPDAVAA
jgi:VanZ family protein